MWEDARILLLRFLRQASERGLPGLALDLERLRERATVQLRLAERDCGRRYVAPRKAALEAKERAGSRRPGRVPKTGSEAFGAPALSLPFAMLP